MKILLVIIGAATMLSAFGVMAILYHTAMQQMWREITKEEFEERYARDFERRWKNQDVRIHAQLVIVDEMDNAAQRAEIKQHRRAG